MLCVQVESNEYAAMTSKILLILLFCLRILFIKRFIKYSQLLKTEIANKMITVYIYVNTSLYIIFLSVKNLPLCFCFKSGHIRINHKMFTTVLAS